MDKNQGPQEGKFIDLTDDDDELYTPTGLSGLSGPTTPIKQEPGHDELSDLQSANDDSESSGVIDKLRDLDSSENGIQLIGSMLSRERSREAADPGLSDEESLFVPEREPSMSEPSLHQPETTTPDLNPPVHDDGAHNWDRGADTSRLRKDDTGPPHDKTKEPGQGQKRAKPARTAREFWARENEREELKEQQKDEKKRKREEAGKKPRKVSKTCPTSHHWQQWDQNEASKSRAATLFVTNNLKTAVKNGELPSMGAITAKTKAEQFAKIRASMAQGGDTRRLKSQESDLEKASRSFGLGHCKVDNGVWVLHSMKTGLMHYQLTIAAWMIKREAARSEPYGGLVADEMGMGKTLVSLACIGEHPPEIKDVEKWCHATLVIVPNRTVAEQWLDEIQKHCHEKLSDKASIYNPAEKRFIGKYKRQSIVLTTYHELIRQYPPIKVIQELKEKCSGDPDSFHREMAAVCGEFFRVDWYRVILDEAHKIKDTTSQTSLACCALSSKYRWALSGTPLANSALEFYPYLRFLGCRFTDDLKDYRYTYVNGDEAAANFEALVSLIMYRRTRKDAFLGCKIIDLPESITQDLKVPLSKSEEITFWTVHNHYDVKLQVFRNKKMRRALTEKEKEIESAIRFAMLMALRQAVSHPFGLETVFRKKLSGDEVSIMTAKLNAQEKTSTMLGHLKSNANGSTRISLFAHGLSLLGSYSDTSFGGIFDMKPLLKLAENEANLQGVTCPHPECRKSPPIKPIGTPNCQHVYCEKCIIKTCHDRGNKTGKCLEPGCFTKLLLGKDIGTIDRIMEAASNDKEHKELAADANGVQIGRDPSRNGFFTAAMRLGHVTIAPSAKLSMAMAVILEWQAQFPEDKIIVFTQFVMTGKILGYMLGKAGTSFLYYYGTLSGDQKKNAIDKFKKDTETKILLAGLMCGGQALNLTVANRVILIDPWWNTTQEQQAFCRVSRKGQTKKTHLVRILTDTKIDNRISELQTKKSAIVDYALQDDGHVPLQASEEQLQKLFAPIDSSKKSKKK